MWMQSVAEKPVLPYRYLNLGQMIPYLLRKTYTFLRSHHLHRRRRRRHNLRLHIRIVSDVHPLHLHVDLPDIAPDLTILAGKSDHVMVSEGGSVLD
jgi:hypothetical protein